MDYSNLVSGREVLRATEARGPVAAAVGGTIPAVSAARTSEMGARADLTEQNAVVVAGRVGHSVTTNKLSLPLSQDFHSHPDHHLEKMEGTAIQMELYLELTIY